MLNVHKTAIELYGRDMVIFNTFEIPTSSMVHCYGSGSGEVNLNTRSGLILGVL